MTSVILTNAKVVTEDCCFLGTLVIEHGTITAVDRGTTKVPGAIDCDGDHLLPGLVELHTDNLEKHVQPRAGVRWPTSAAALSHDAQITAAGITTVFDAVALGDVSEDSDRLRNLSDMVTAISGIVSRGLARARHYLHLRCEVSYEKLPDLVNPLIDDPLVKLISVMDHAPGQRQFADPETYARFYRDNYKLDEDTLRREMERHAWSSREYAPFHRTWVSELCRQRGLPMASHDDATRADVSESVTLGVRIAEFPTTMEAATASRTEGLSVMMGAPNLVRGQSHSGNVSALALAEEGALDILSSDYMPSSLLMAVLKLWRHAGWRLPDAVSLVTARPARAVGLRRLGTLEPGNIGDVIRVHFETDVVAVRQVWRAGERVM